MGWKALLVGLVLLFAWKSVRVAQHDGPALPDEDLSQDQLIQRLSYGALTLRDLRKKGLEIFVTPFNTHDGYGDGPFTGQFPTKRLSNRPTLQGNGLSLRINGLDAQSCNECHAIVKQSTRPPTLGIGGAGGLVQNAIIMPSLVDVGDSSDDRVNYSSGHAPDLPMEFDGKADFNGRYSNPPFLFGGGGLELLAKEMTADLQRLLSIARNLPEGSITHLNTHGVNFGFLRTQVNGEVELHVEGIGFKDNSRRSPEEVLVVRPFGRKGEKFSMRDFALDAMQFHFGLQPVEVVGDHVDADGDGVANEATVFEMSALHVFSVTNPVPFMEQRGLPGQRGFSTFQAIGCSQCHIPVMQTRSRILPLSFPEVPRDPWKNVYLEIDLVEVGFEPVPGGDGVLVPLFADLKRHDMGDGLKEDFELAEISNREFTTARLWGVADTAPYLHDGRATTLFQAIEAHGGEAQDSRDAFLALSVEERQQLISFLGRLRTPNRPNQELLPLVSPPFSDNRESPVCLFLDCLRTR